jgi:hypothetical protein
LRNLLEERDIWRMVAAALGVSRGRQLCCGPAAQLRDEDGVDPAGSGQRQNLGAFGAPIVGTRCRLLEDGHDLVAGTFGERPQVPLLALARLDHRSRRGSRWPLVPIEPAAISFVKTPVFTRPIALQPPTERNTNEMRAIVKQTFPCGCGSVSQH